MEITLFKTTFFFYKKDVHSKNCSMQKKHKAKPEVQKGGKKKHRKLITKERAKKHRDRITRCESPSLRSIKKRTTKRGKQLVIRSIHVLKSLPTTFLQNTPN